MTSISYRNTTKGRPPRLPFEAIKDAVLGKKYDLSLVFIGDKRSRKLNYEFKGKDKPTNVLSFPYDKSSGEMFINLKQVERDTVAFKQNAKNLTGFFFIHGCLHLKGHDHGSTMSKAEQRYCKRFGIPYPFD